MDYTECRLVLYDEDNFFSKPSHSFAHICLYGLFVCIGTILFLQS